MTIIFFKENEIVPYQGGISRINLNLCDALRKYGVRCFFLSSARKYETSYSFQLWLPNMQCVYSEENISWLSNFIAENDVDVIINSTFDQNVVKMLDDARNGTRCQLLTWIHNNFVEYGSLVGYRIEPLLKKYRLGFISRLMTCNWMISALRICAKHKHKATAKTCYQYSDRIITTHDGNIGEYIYLLGHKDTKNKVIAIPNFILQLNEEVTLEEKEKIIIWCGSIDFVLKKTDWMLEIWKKIQSTHRDWTLVIMGDNKYLEAMKKYAYDLGVERVVFTGRIDPNKYYKKASILCSTSISESFGLTIVEGMQLCVVPVVFASSPAIRGIVGYNGKLIKPFNLKVFASELSDLMNNVSHREFLAEKCRIASKLYQETQIVRLWLKLLQSF